MTPPVPQTEPQTLVAGDTWAWTKTLSNYPATDLWVLGYAIRGQSVLPNAKVIVSTSGIGFSVSVAKADTGVLIAGAYQWQSFVDKVATGEHYTVEQGVFTIVQSLSSVSDSSAVSHVERMIIKLDAEIEARMTGTGSSHESYSINGRSIMKIPMKELQSMAGMYRARLYRLRNQGALGPSVLAVMTNPDGAIGSAQPTVLPPWYRALNS